MPLLNIYGVTGGNKVIQLGLVFLSGKKESDYYWVLVNLKEIMVIEGISFRLSIVMHRELALMKSLEVNFPSIPHLLCRWHVNINVLARSKRYFPPPTRQGVFDRILLFWAAQQSSIADNEAQDQHKPRHNTNHPMLTNLIGYIHNYALQKLVLEVRKVPEQATSCSCTIRVAYGLPCCHEVFEFIRAKTQLSKADIHRHWWFNRSQNLDANIRINIIDTRVIPSRVRPRGALRYSSQFEHTIQEERREAFRVRGHDQGQNQGRLKRKRGENADNIEDSHSKTRIPLHNRVSRSTVALGISRLEVHGDLHEPETTSERFSGKVLSKI
ncbi:hypothetical protein GcC1_192003 [Golovinomyces cichoracearum]|uniref:MULE transposase domain-containing protein n=1 Tax=Golovinomyces cichoracearum TaxID=62708 RepID=A0A420HHX6_9PEZI|nr:hypothetical protein GcC1_192003 [Golovinomyces cichoracearum]